MQNLVNQKIKLRYLLILIFIISGFDLYRINIFGINFRYIQLLSIYIFFFYFNKIIYKSYLLFLGFFLTHLVATFFSNNIYSSFQYIIWLLFNYFLFSFIYTNFIKNYESTYIAFLSSFRIIAILVIITFHLSIFNLEIYNWVHQTSFSFKRVQLWFYEPSYLAIYLNAYLYIGILEYKRNNNYYDVILSLISIILVVSTTGFIAILIYIFFISFYLYKKIIKILIPLILITLIGYLLYPEIFDIFLGRIFLSGLKESSGDRFFTINEGISLIKNNLWIGYGPNINESVGILPANITIELILSAGLPGALFFYLFILSQIKFDKLFLSNNFIFFVILISTILLLQSTQNYYRIYFWILLAFIAASFNNRVKIK